MRSSLDVNQAESYLSLPKLETKNQFLYKKNTLNKRISFIRESQDNIQVLEQMSQEFAKEGEKHSQQPYSFIHLPLFLQRNSSYAMLQPQWLKDDLTKHHDIPYNHPTTLQHSATYNQNKKNLFSSSGRLNKINHQDEAALGRKLETSPDVQQTDKQKVDRMMTYQQQQKFKKLNLQKTQTNPHNLEEEAFIKNNWNEQQKYELQTGETLNFLFKNLAENVQNLSKYKSEKYCIKIIEKYVNYNRKLRQLIDITNTPFKEYNATLLLQRYFKILFKILHTTQIKQANTSPLPNNNESNQFNNTLTHSLNPPTQAVQGGGGGCSATKTTSIKEEPSTIIGELKPSKDKINSLQIVHDKQFLDNILDLNSRLEDWIMGMQKSQVQQFSTQIVDITQKVFEKELSYQNQLINHSKKQSYIELKNLIQEKYSLNLRIMKSKLCQQIRSCEEKNGDIKFVHRQNINMGECLDKVINKLEKIDLN